MTNLDKKNSRVGILVAGTAVLMVGMAYAAVPLYELFCQVTGYGGTTQEVAEVDSTVIERGIKVRFDASTHRDMAWEFKPSQNNQQLKIGEQSIAYYEAYNPTNKTIVGRATYNVTPHKAGSYFAKIDCFCFTEQVLKPGERIDMPVVYYIDPSIDEDPNLNEVTEVTLSYTFFALEGEEAEEAIVASGR
ncbi:cytochrome c oxidase assembly protein [Kordiimonas sp. SCSIO 12610]|uniref:cytochrome c oxidase assembly protein n=1 Tax=Kordiimonas sp. SCSIO 12610 TaxID=2829597 RepID=UPI00210A676F|nr:cytochrome c oxidase assembly protein [Kordiimonas sp. SCSIO 12610]UTW54910.1 cytochrome c oxidase assembly protein [Kordiimonas sp. SCSIO 12610]